MKHPFEVLRDEYTRLLGAMVIRPDKRDLVDHVAIKLISYKPRFEPVSKQNGVPIIFMATSFEREAGCDFTKNPAQGWPWRQRSKWIPKNGPFPSWQAAALEAYRLNGLDKVGAGNWTWELLCFYGEMFNGFGYRDYHAMHTPYLWGGTNIQSPGKYTSDGIFDAGKMDTQLGIIPVARRMVELDPDLALSATAIPPPRPSGIGDHTEAAAIGSVSWIQTALNELGQDPPLLVDGNYGRKTFVAVKGFQHDYGIEVDGLAGPQTIGKLQEAVAVKDSTEP